MPPNSLVLRIRFDELLAEDEVVSELWISYRGEQEFKGNLRKMILEKIYGR